VIALIVMFFTAAPPISAEGTEAPPEKGTTVHEVHIHKGADQFIPAVLKIRVGDTVTWINDDDRGHPIASIPGKGTNDRELFTPPIPPGKSWSHTFQKPGEYPYFCYIHYVMMGVVIVEDGQEQVQ